MQRREFFATVTASLAATRAAESLGQAQAPPKVQRRGRIKQALFRGVFGRTSMSFDDASLSLGRAVCGVLAIVAVADLSASQSRPAESDQQVLVRLERQWNEAFYRKDVTFIETLLADEFIATYDDGSRGDKAKELALAAAFNQQVESAIQDEFAVKVYGDTAVVWFTLHLVGIKQGQRSGLTLRYTDVWIIRDGRWQCVSSQSTRVNTK
jgi:ketosteroid isomerase-like protein